MRFLNSCQAFVAACLEALAVFSNAPGSRPAIRSKVLAPGLFPTSTGALRQGQPLAGSNVAPDLGVHTFSSRRWPFDYDAVNGEEGRSQSEVNPCVARAQIAAIGVNTAPERRLALAKHGYARSDSVAVSMFCLQPNHKKPVTWRCLIQEQPHWTVVVADDDIDVAVIVDIADCRTPADIASLKCRTSSIRDVVEAPRFDVSKELISLTVRIRRSP